MANSSFTVWSKAGTLLGEQDLNLFFLVPSGYRFSDPRILYDSPSGRWFASGLAFNASNASQAYLAVSFSSDPMGSWQIYSTATSADLFDQPKIGVSADKLVMSWNEFSGPSTFLGQLTQVLQKSDLLAAVAPTVTVFNLDSTRFNLVPVPDNDSATAYLVYNGDTLRGSVFAGAYVGVVAITGTPLAANVVWTESDPSIVATVIPPSAQQPGAAPLLDTGDDRFLSASVMSGTIWVAGNDACLPSGDSNLRSCLRLIQVSITAAPIVLTDIDEGSLGTDLFYPAVATDTNGNLLSVFSASSPSLYAGAYAGVQPAGTSAGLALATVQPGLGSYNYSVCGLRNRWGDYSAAGLDPIDIGDVWLGGEYAAASTDSCNWGTAVARVTLSAPALTSIVPTSGPATGGTVVTINGSDFVAGATTVMFGTVTSSSVTVGSPNQLTAVTPLEPAGTVQVTVITPDGASAPLLTSRFTFIDRTPPAFQSISVLPSEASAGQVVVVTAQISDPDGTVASASIRYSSSDHPAGAAASANFFLASGTGLDGTWQAQIVVPPGAASGTWTVYELSARDLAGNAIDILAPTTPTLSGTFVVTRLPVAVGRSVPLGRGDGPPPPVLQLLPSGAPARLNVGASNSNNFNASSPSTISSPPPDAYHRAMPALLDAISRDLAAWLA